MIHFPPDRPKRLKANAKDITNRTYFVLFYHLHIPSQSDVRNKDDALLQPVPGGDY
jgi:hypothetical protein